MVRRSAWRGLKSVEASTISSPFRQPVASSTSIRLLPRSAVVGQLGPGMLAVAVQAERAAHQHDAAVAHGVDVLAGDLVGQGDGGLVRVWGLASVPICSSPPRR